MKRRTFIQNTSLLGAGVLASKFSFAAAPDFPVVRVALEKRHFTSVAVDNAIKTFQANVADKELGWLFENCFPNTLDTTVTYSLQNGRPDTYVIDWRHRCHVDARQLCTGLALPTVCQ